MRFRRAGAARAFLYIEASGFDNGGTEADAMGSDWPMRRLHAILVILFLPSFLLPSLLAQSVISVRSGLINFSEGAVFVDNQPVVNKFGRYASLKDGSDLLTQDGRVELLLTPSAYLRVGQNSGVRLISGDLSGTQVELLSGSAI